MGYWATTQVKGFSPEIHIVSEVETVHEVEDSSLIVANSGQNHRAVRPKYAMKVALTMRDGENPTGSKTVARYQMERVGTWETQYIPAGVCDDKPEKVRNRK